VSEAEEQEALLALLDWYEAMGVDAVLGDSPVDRFAEGRAGAAASPAGRPAPRPPAPPRVPTAFAEPPSAGLIPGNDGIASARMLAAEAQTLDALRAALAGFEGCRLKATAKSLVFADGNPNGRVMLIGEAPGREEDVAGLPFVGRSGRLLDRMLAGIGLDRTNVYIANVIPWRPPGNRTPSDLEVELCKPFIERQIALAAPEIIVFLGAQSLKALTGAKDGIHKARGRWRSYEAEGRAIRAIATLHPAYLLREPLQKRLAWADLMKVKAALEGRG